MGCSDAGYQGFVTIAELRSTGLSGIPACSGTYCVILPEGMTPTFLTSSRGGRFRGKDPTVDQKELQSQWVDGTSILYIGSAGDLRRRIGQFLRFGEGRPVGHWGGRYIWQVKEAEQLLLAWAPSPDPLGTEAQTLVEFEAAYGRLPFANLTGGASSSRGRTQRQSIPVPTLTCSLRARAIGLIPDWLGPLTMMLGLERHRRLNSPSSASETVDELIDAALLAGATEVYFEPERSDSASFSFMVVSHRARGVRTRIGTFQGIDQWIPVVVEVGRRAGMDLDGFRRPQHGTITLDRSARKYELCVCYEPAPLGAQITIHVFPGPNKHSKEEGPQPAPVPAVPAGPTPGLSGKDAVEPARNERVEAETEMARVAQDVTRRGRMLLHEAIAEVLRHHGGGPMHANDIAAEVNRLGLYSRGDQEPVQRKQIVARISHHTDAFERTSPGHYKLRQR